MQHVFYSRNHFGGSTRSIQCRSWLPRPNFTKIGAAPDNVKKRRSKLGRNRIRGDACTAMCLSTDCTGKSDKRSSSRRCARRGRPPADGPRLSGGRPEPARRASDASSSTLSLTRTLRPYQGPHALQGGGPALDPRNFRSNASYIKTSPRGEPAEKSPKSRRNLA